MKFRQVASAELAALRSEFTWAWAQKRLRQAFVPVLAITVLTLVLGSAGSILRESGFIGEDSVDWLAIGRDGAIVETAGYLFFGLSSLLLMKVYRESGRVLVLLLAGLVAYLLFDDMFMVHDRARLYLGALFRSDDSFLRTEDFGEVIFTSIAFVTASAVFFAFWRRISLEDFRTCIGVIAGVGLFLSFAVGLDEIHQILKTLIDLGTLSEPAFTFVEDGGELIAQGLTMLAALALYLRLTATLKAKSGAIPVHETVAAE